PYRGAPFDGTSRLETTTPSTSVLRRFQTVSYPKPHKIQKAPQSKMAVEGGGGFIFLRRSAGFDELVDDGIHQRLERGVDDVRRDPDRRPMIAGLVRAFDQDARHRLRAAIEDTHAIIGEREPGDVALIFAEVLAQREIERVDRTDAFGDRDQLLVADLD